ncbi:MAG: hypothetical protein JNN00_06790 [Chitinophagaceae bacterium]|nr:hypothetical protein [Chitinophagaceae bacterium]
MNNEAEWIKLIFLLADIQTWVDDLCKETFSRLPVHDKKKFLRKTYFLSVPAFAHILERHYHKVNRHPHAGKFTISIIEILNYIREACSVPVTPAPGCSNFQRVLQAPVIIGFDKNGIATDKIAIVTDAGGKIITAFPGSLQISEL